MAEGPRASHSGLDGGSVAPQGRRRTGAEEPSRSGTDAGAAEEPSRRTADGGADPKIGADDGESPGTRPVAERSRKTTPVAKETEEPCAAGRWPERGRGSERAEPALNEQTALP
ncbi:hypothetical protein GCM10010399_38430 [Dactylosporangium fulvum]